MQFALNGGSTLSVATAVKLKFNEYLILWRDRAGLSQGDIARRLGVCRQTVIKWEKGTAIPKLNPHQSWTYANILDVSPKEMSERFLGGRVNE